MKIMSNDLNEYLDGYEGLCRIHSVFDHSINLQTEECLFAVFCDIKNVAPMSVVLDELDFRCLKNLDTEEIQLSKHLLIFPNGNIIDLNNSVIWNTTLRSSFNDFKEKDLKRTKKVIKEMILKEGDFQGLGYLVHTIDELYDPEYQPCPEMTNDYVDFIKPKIIEFIEVLSTGSFETINQRASEMIGLGPGLTPSSDDLLSGFMIYLIYMGQSMDLSKEIIKQLTDSIVKNLGEQTNEISKSYMIHASEGKLNKRVKSLMISILSQSKGLKQNVEEVIRFGGTSGTDLMVGIYLGMNMILDEKFKGRLTG